VQRTATAAPIVDLRDREGGSDGLSKGEAIAIGCSVGGVALLAVCVLWFLVCRRKKAAKTRGSEPDTKPASGAIKTV
jgi:hypothetical protein